MVDKIDLRILNYLYQDSDQPRKSMAEYLKISEPNLSKRLTSLKETGIIKNFSVNLNYKLLRQNVQMMTLISMKTKDPEELNDLANKICEIEEAVEVYTIFGKWDIWVKWAFKDADEGMKIINSALLGRKYVKNTKTITLGEEFKRERGPLLRHGIEDFIPIKTDS